MMKLSPDEVFGLSRFDLEVEARFLPMGYFMTKQMPSWLLGPINFDQLFVYFDCFARATLAAADQRGHHRSLR